MNDNHKPKNFSRYDGCSCFTMNNPPCSYCENTGSCDLCGSQYNSEDLTEYGDNFICPNCLELNTAFNDFLKENPEL